MAQIRTLHRMYQGKIAWNFNFTPQSDEHHKATLCGVDIACHHTCKKLHTYTRRKRSLLAPTFKEVQRTYLRYKAQTQ